MKLSSHRSVAVIIAHMLLIAIAVIGGMLIFVFVQDFIQTTQVSAPQVEQLMIWGYNATEKSVNKLGTHSRQDVIVTNKLDNQLSDGEDFFLFVRNYGGTDVFISEIKVFGVPFTPDTTSSSSGNLDAAPGMWILSTNGKDPCRCQMIKSGQEATIAIGYDENVNGPINVGKNVHVNIQTGGGFSFTKYVEVGSDRG